MYNEKLESEMANSNTKKKHSNIFSFNAFNFVFFIWPFRFFNFFNVAFVIVIA